MGAARITPATSAHLGARALFAAVANPPGSSRGHAGDDGVRRNVAGDDRTGGDERAFADGRAAYDRRIGADGGAASDARRFDSVATADGRPRRSHVREHRRRADEHVVVPAPPRRRSTRCSGCLQPSPTTAVAATNTFWPSTQRAPDPRARHHVAEVPEIFVPAPMRAPRSTRRSGAPSIASSNGEPAAAARARGRRWRTCSDAWRAS